MVRFATVAKKGVTSSHLPLFNYLPSAWSWRPTLPQNLCCSRLIIFLQQGGPLLALFIRHFLNAPSPLIKRARASIPTIWETYRETTGYFRETFQPARRKCGTEKGWSSNFSKPARSDCYAGRVLQNHLDMLPNFKEREGNAGNKSGQDLYVYGRCSVSSFVS